MVASLNVLQTVLAATFRNFLLKCLSDLVSLLRCEIGSAELSQYQHFNFEMSFVRSVGFLSIANAGL